MRLGLLLAIALGTTACAPPQTGAGPQLIITNARIFTADPEKPWARAVAIEGDRILAVGDSIDVTPLARENTLEIDAGGRLIVPGLTDAHMHLGLYGSSCARLPPVNLPYPGPTPDELLAAVKSAAAIGEGWICGTMGPLVVEDGRNWRAALDAVAPNRPVVVSARK